MATSEQTNIRIAQIPAEDLRLVADWMKEPYAAYLRTVIENHWHNPGTQALIRRAKSEMADRTNNQ